MNELEVAGFVPFSSSEWPGKKTFVVFVPGCNFSCPYCFSAPFIQHPTKIERIPAKKVAEEMQRALSQGAEAVMVSGGEPTLHGIRLLDFLGNCQDNGFKTAICTNASNPFIIKSLIEEKLLDYLAFDIKHSFRPEKYFAATGKKAVLSKVLQSLEIVKKSGIDCEYRFTFVEGLHSVFDVKAAARQLRGAKRFVLQQFTPQSGTLDAEFEKKEKTSYEEMLRIAEEIKGIQEVRLRTEKGEEIVSQDARAELKVKT